MVLIAVLERVPHLYRRPPAVNPPIPDPAPAGNEPNRALPWTADPQPPDVRPSPGHPRPIDRASTHGV